MNEGGYTVGVVVEIDSVWDCECDCSIGGDDCWGYNDFVVD